MPDKPETSGSDSSSTLARDLLLAALRGKPGASKRALEFAQLAFVPSLILFEGDVADAQKLATNYYEAKKPFASQGDEKRHPTNQEALKLILANIRLHEDADGKRTVNDSGQIRAVNLADAKEKAQLRSWLVFPYAYKDAKAVAAPLHREGFRLAMKEQGFAVTDAGTTATKDRLTPTEKMRLSLITVYSALQIDEDGKVETPRNLRTHPLSPVEKEAFDEALKYLAKTLPSDRPGDFMANLSAALDLCKDPQDRVMFRKAISALLRADVTPNPIADSFEKWMQTIYSKPIADELYKDPKKLKEWLDTNAPKITERFAFPDDERPESLLAYLRKLHTAAFSENWGRTMKLFPDADARTEIQYLMRVALGRKDRFGAEAGLLLALNDTAIREDGNLGKPADPEKVAKKIDEAGNDRAGVAAKADPPGHFVVEPLNPPGGKDDQWPWYTWAFGIPLAGFAGYGMWLALRTIPVINWPLLLTEWGAKKGWNALMGGDSDVVAKLRDDKMTRDKTGRQFKTDAEATFKHVDASRDRADAGRRVTKFMNDFALLEGLDTRVGDGKLKVAVEFSADAVEATNGMRKARVIFITEGDTTTMRMIFPTNTTAADMAHDCYISLYELERSGKGTEKALSPAERAQLSRNFNGLDVNPSRDGEGARRTVAEALPDRGSTATPEPVRISFAEDGVSIGRAKYGVEEVTRAIRDELKDKLDRLREDGKKEGDREFDEAKRAYDEHDTILKNLNSEDASTKETARRQAVEKVKTAFEADDGKLGKRFSEDLHRGGGDERGRSRAVVLAMFAQRFVTPAALVVTGLAIGSTARGSEAPVRRAPIVPIIPKKKDR